MGETLNALQFSLESGRVPPKRLEADLYAALHAGNPGDVEFYRRMCRGAARVLEFGSGAGRITLALAAEGAEVTGVELDIGLLGLARERAAALGRDSNTSFAATFEQGDMTTFRSSPRFARVLVPYSALWCLRGKEAKARCLRNAYHCLVPGGQLILDVYDADIWADEDEDGPSSAPDAAFDTFEPLPSVVVQGETYQVWERNRWDAALREMHVEYRLRQDRGSERHATGSPGDSPVWSLHLSHSVLWRHELSELLEDCGFEVEWGVDECDEGTEFAEQVVVRALKP